MMPDATKTPTIAKHASWWDTPLRRTSCSITAVAMCVLLQAAATPTHAAAKDRLSTDVKRATVAALISRGERRSEKRRPIQYASPAYQLLAALTLATFGCTIARRRTSPVAARHLSYSVTVQT